MKKANVTMKKLLAGLGMAAMMLTVPVITVNAASEVTIDAKHFPDKSFRTYVSKEIDTDKNGKLSQKEITKVKKINVWNCGIKNLTGIKYFTNLQELDCAYNKLTKLDISKNTKLTSLACYDNKLTKLDVSKNTKLTSLSCDNNKLTKLDVSKNTKLTSLSCGYNKLTKLDVSKNTNLTGLGCSGNKLTKLDVSKNTELKELGFAGTELTKIDLSNNKKLEIISCDKYLYADGHEECVVEIIGLIGDDVTFDCLYKPKN